MRRFGIGFAILSLLLAIGVGIGAYSIGYHHGLAVKGSVEVVRYVGWHVFGFFPFGLFLFPLFFIAIFALMRAAFWRGGHHDHPGPWGYGPGGGWGHHGHQGPWGHGPGGPMGTAKRDAFEDWHRRQHEPDAHDGGGEPAAT